MKILRMKDGAAKHRIDKGPMPPLPFRMVLVGKSLLAGKTNALGNLLLRPYDATDIDGQYGYMNDFHGYNIFVICSSKSIDKLWGLIIGGKMIPPQNIYTDFDEQVVESIYKRIEGLYQEAEDEGKPHDQFLIILDDMGWSGVLREKAYGVLNRIATAGRHILFSMIITAQKYTSVHTTIRENMTCGLFWSCSNKQLDLIYEDHGMISKKKFTKIFRDATRVKHTFMVINYNVPFEDMYQDTEFNPIKFEED